MTSPDARPRRSPRRGAAGRRAHVPATSPAEARGAAFANLASCSAHRSCLQLPPSALSSNPPAARAATIVETAQATPDLSILVEAVVAANLVEAVSPAEDAPITVLGEGRF